MHLVVMENIFIFSFSMTLSLLKWCRLHKFLAIMFVIEIKVGRALKKEKKKKKKVYAFIQ